MPLQVVASEDVSGLVDQARPGLADLLAQRRQPPVLLVRAPGDIHLTQATDGFALQQPIPIDPQQLAQRGGVSSIGFAFLAFLGLDQNHLVAMVIMEHADQPIVKATDLEHGHERVAVAQTLAGEFLKESLDLVRMCGHLAGQQDIPVFIAERDGDLPCMLVDSQIENHGGSPVGRWVKEVDTLPYPMGEPLLLDEVALSQIPPRAMESGLRTYCRLDRCRLSEAPWTLMSMWPEQTGGIAMHKEVLRAEARWIGAREPKNPLEICST